MARPSYATGDNRGTITGGRTGSSPIPKHKVDFSVSEIEFRTLYVVAERWILGCMLRFMHAKNHFSDTLVCCHRITPQAASYRNPTFREFGISRASLYLRLARSYR